MINQGLANDFRVYYWREGNQEVDFVLEKRGAVIGLEVKSGPTRSYHSGMAAFKQKFQPQRVLLVGDGGLSWPEFLAMNPDGLF